MEYSKGLTYSIGSRARSGTSPPTPDASFWSEPTCTDMNYVRLAANIAA
jgi:hypothetical protein